MGRTASALSTPGQAGAGRLKFLDALRGLAAAYVVVYHMLLLPQPNLTAPKWVEKFALAGGTGVTLFFIVSAFSLYYTMPLRARDKRPILSFYLHRLFRIAPLFYFWIVASMVRDYYVFGAAHEPASVLLHVVFAFNLVPGQEEGFVWAGWTIGVEMVFYAFFPVFFHYVRTTGNAVALFFAMLLAWLAMQIMLDYMVLPAEWKESILRWSSFRHFPIFAVGVVAFHIFASTSPEEFDSGRLRSLGNALVFGGAFGFAALLQGWLPGIFGDMYYWQGPVFGAVFLGLAFAPWRLVVNAATAFLGKISYSIYLNHTTVIYLLQPVYQRIYGATDSLSVAFLSCLVLTLAVTLPVSMITYRLVEKPGIALGKKLIARFAT